MGKMIYIWVKEGLIKHKYTELEEKFWRWLAYKVSKHLVYWCTLRLMINSPDDKYGGQAIPDISTREALDRWLKRWVQDHYY